MGETIIFLKNNCKSTMDVFTALKKMIRGVKFFGFFDYFFIGTISFFMGRILYYNQYMVLLSFFLFIFLSNDFFHQLKNKKRTILQKS